MFLNSVWLPYKNCKGRTLEYTRELEIYDPMSVEGAIVTQRSRDGSCLLLETLQLHHTVKVFHVWKLFQKSKRVNCSMVSMVTTDVEILKKKKRKGKKRHISYVAKKSYEAPL